MLESLMIHALLIGYNLDITHTARLHVGDFMFKHMRNKVNSKFNEWMNHNYDKHGEIKSKIGKVHEYLGMSFDFTKKRN